MPATAILIVTLIVSGYGNVVADDPWYIFSHDADHLDSYLMQAKAVESAAEQLLGEVQVRPVRVALVRDHQQFDDLVRRFSKRLRQRLNLSEVHGITMPRHRSIIVRSSGSQNQIDSTLRHEYAHWLHACYVAKHRAQLGIDADTYDDADTNEVVANFIAWSAADSLFTDLSDDPAFADAVDALSRSEWNPSSLNLRSYSGSTATALLIFLHTKDRAASQRSVINDLIVSTTATDWVNQNSTVLLQQSIKLRDELRARLSLMVPTIGCL